MYYLTELNTDGIGSVEQSEYIVQCGQCIGEINDAVATDAVFLGWYTKPNGEGNKVNMNKMIYAPTTIYAHWGAK